MRNELFKGLNKMGNINCYMLLTDKGVMLCGSDVEARAMLSQMVYQLKSHGLKDDDLREAVELGLMSDEEREQKTNEKIESLIEKLFGR